VRGLVRQLGHPALLAASYSGNSSAVAAEAVHELEEGLVGCLEELTRLQSSPAGPDAASSDALTGRPDWTHIFISVLPAMPTLMTTPSFSLDSLLGGSENQVGEREGGGRKEREEREERMEGKGGGWERGRGGEREREEERAGERGGLPSFLLTLSFSSPPSSRPLAPLLCSPLRASQPPQAGGASSDSANTKVAGALRAAAAALAAKHMTAFRGAAVGQLEIRLRPSQVSRAAEERQREKEKGNGGRQRRGKGRRRRAMEERVSMLITRHAFSRLPHPFRVLLPVLLPSPESTAPRTNILPSPCSALLLLLPLCPERASVARGGVAALGP
jgi:hypothetical protein